MWFDSTCVIFFSLVVRLVDIINIESPLPPIFSNHLVQQC